MRTFQEHSARCPRAGQIVASFEDVINWNFAGTNPAMRHLSVDKCVIRHGAPMAAGDDYRIKAADMNARARREIRPRARAELASLALAYLRLAEQADRNASVGSSTEHSAAPLQQQQQQQPQLKRQRGDDAGQE
jgi:hypothetical protein